MTSASVPEAATFPSAEMSPGQRRLGLAGIGVIALAWFACLATMVAVDSNPVVLNRVQIAAADVVIQGTLVPGSKDKLRVSKDWKGHWKGQEINLSGPTPQAFPPGEFLAPITLTSPSGGRITQGLLHNLPAHPGGTVAAARSEVKPLVYPANDDTLAQLSSLLNGSADEHTRVTTSSR